MSTEKITETFDPEQLIEMGLPYDAPEGGRVISDDITGKSRWSVHHLLVVQFAEQVETDKAWAFTYSVGATECQEERPWEYDNEVTARLVRKVTKTVEVWE